MLQEMRGAEGIGQQHAQIAVVKPRPILKHLEGRRAQFVVVSGERGIDHRQFMRVGADRLKAEVHGVLDIGGADQAGADPLMQSFDAPALP